MKTITPWSVAMSAFFSLSITGSLYGAGRDHLEAAAGNPAGVERTRGDLAGRTGLGAPAPVVIPAAGGVQVANRAPSLDLAPAIAWVMREGRNTTNDG